MLAALATAFITAPSPQALPQLAASAPLRSAEARRVQDHLHGAERLLLSGPSEALSRERAARRTWAFQTLQAYREAGQFPLNRTSSVQTPIFIDQQDTHCALGALIAASGEEALARRIQRSENLSRVAELVGVEPDLLAWLHEHGLSVEEAARIQPSYCIPRAALICESRYLIDAPPGLAVIEVGDLVQGDEWVGTVVSVHGETGDLAEGDVVKRTELSSPGERVAYTVRGGQLGQVLAAADPWGIRLWSDPPCAASPHVAPEVFLEALQSTPEDCVARMEGVAPGWSRPFCQSQSDIDCGDAALPTFDEGPWTPVEAPVRTADRETQPTEDGGGCRSAGPVLPPLFAMLLVAGLLGRRRRGES